MVTKSVEKPVNLFVKVMQNRVPEYKGICSLLSIKRPYSSKYSKDTFPRFVRYFINSCCLDISMKEYDSYIKNKYMSETRTKKCDQSITILLDSTHLTFPAIMIALGYISKLEKTSVTSSLLSHQNNSEVKILTLALMASMKAHYDNVYSNKSWSTVSGIPLKELNVLESNFLRDINFDLFIDEATFFYYMDTVEYYLEKYYKVISDSLNKVNSEAFDNSSIPSISSKNSRNFKRPSETLTPSSSPNQTNKKENLYKNLSQNSSQGYLGIPEKDAVEKSNASIYSNESYSSEMSDKKRNKPDKSNSSLNQIMKNTVQTSPDQMSQNSVKDMQNNSIQNDIPKRTTSNKFIPKRTSSNNLNINSNINFGYKNNSKVITLPSTQDTSDSTHGSINHSKSSGHQQSVDSSNPIYRNKTVSLSNYPVPAPSSFSQGQLKVPYYQQQISYSQPVYPYYMDIIYPVNRNNTPQPQHSSQISVLPLAPNPAMIQPQSLNSGTIPNAIPSPLSPQYSNGIPIHQNSFHSPQPYVGNVITTPVNNLYYPTDTPVHIISPPPIINPNLSNYSLSSQEYVDNNNISQNYNSDGYNSNSNTDNNDSSYDDSLYYHDILDNDNASSISRSNTIGGSQNVRNELKSKNNNQNQFLHPNGYSQMNNPYGYDNINRSSSYTYERPNSYDNNINAPHSHSLSIENNMRMNYPGDMYKNSSLDSSNKSNGYVEHSLSYGYMNSMSSSYPVVYNSSFSLSSQSSIVNNDTTSSYYSGSLRRSGFSNFLNNKKPNSNDNFRNNSISSRNYSENNGSINRNRNYNNNYRYKSNYVNHSNSSTYNSFSKDKSKLNNMSTINSEETLSKSQPSISIMDENNNQINEKVVKNDKDTLVEQSEDENETVLPNGNDEEESIHDDKDKYNENMATPKVLNKFNEIVKIKDENDEINDTEHNQKELKENDNSYDKKEPKESEEIYDEKELEENDYDYYKTELEENDKENDKENDQNEVEENNEHKQEVNDEEDIFSGSLIDDYINESSSENEEVDKAEIEKERKEEEEEKDEKVKNEKENERKDEGESDVDELTTKDDDTSIEKPNPDTKKVYAFENRRYSSVSFYHLSDTQSNVSRLNKYTYSDVNFDPYIYDSSFNIENAKSEIDNNIKRTNTLVSINSNEADAGYNYERESLYRTAENSFVTAYDDEQTSNINYYNNHEEVENASNYESVRSSIDEFYDRKSHKDHESIKDRESIKDLESLKERRSELLSIRNKNDYLSSSYSSLNMDSHLISEMKSIPPHRILKKPLRANSSSTISSINNRYSTYSNLSNLSNISTTSYPNRNDEKIRYIPDNNSMENIENTDDLQDPKLMKVRAAKKSGIKKTMSLLIESGSKIFTKKQSQSQGQIPSYQNKTQNTNTNEIKVTYSNKELPPLPNNNNSYMEQNKPELIEKKRPSYNLASNISVIAREPSLKSDISTRPMSGNSPNSIY